MNPLDAAWLDLSMHEAQYESARRVGDKAAMFRLGEELFLLRQQVRVMEEEAGVRTPMCELITVGVTQ